MGVNTKAIINRGISLESIVKCIEKNFENVHVVNSQSNDFFKIQFLDDEDSRSMAVFLEYKMTDRDYNISGVLLDLKTWGNAVDIMKVLLNEFGGYLDENDCDDEGFYPINIEKFEQHIETTELDRMKNKIASTLGFENIEKTLKLFEEFQKITS